MFWKHGAHVTTCPQPGRGPQGVATLSHQVDLMGGADRAFLCLFVL